VAQVDAAEAAPLRVLQVALPAVPPKQPHRLSPLVMLPRPLKASAVVAADGEAVVADAAVELLAQPLVALPPAELTPRSMSPQPMKLLRKLPSDASPIPTAEVLLRWCSRPGRIAWSARRSWSNPEPT
jgi:hypothetical protein